jgi:hypothetical protein
VVELAGQGPDDLRGSTVAVAGTSYFAGELQSGEVATSLLIILVSATVTYTVFWKPSGIAESGE